MHSLEKYFSSFRNNIVGIDKTFLSPYGEKKIVYADWIASGRHYEPIGKKMLETFGPLIGNTHSKSSVTGVTMTLSYHYFHNLIKKHVNAGSDDVIITAGSGMTAVVNKF
jgi:selenocysteine lyase/cysteine desulfurase